VSARADEGKGSEGALWFAAVGGVAAWVVHLAVGWLLEEVVACGTATTERGRILGIDLEAWILGLTAVLGVIAVVAGAVGYRRWRRALENGGSARAGREAFMAFAGLLGGFLFLPIIIMGGLQVLTLQPCSP
jgi:hypothetical protein